MGRRRFFVAAGLLAAFLAVAASWALAQDGGQICVAAFEDANRNGMRDPIEPLLPDVVVNLHGAQMIVVDTYLTDGRSEPHCFAGLAAGTYTVSFVGGLVTPTEQDSFQVTLSPGQLVPAQVQFGALPLEAEDAGAAPAAASSADSSETLVRLALAVGGAGLVMAVLAVFGVLIFWMRFRRT